MENLYPAFINLSGKSCLVVGGGKVSERKVQSLLESKACVTLVSPEITESLKELHTSGKITYIPEKYSSPHIEGVFLVICATDIKEVNQTVFSDAREKNILVNVVDKPELCNFYVPSQLKRGDLSIAISTHGRSPALARKIRKELTAQFGDEYAQLLEILGSKREELMTRCNSTEKRGEILKKVVNSDVLEVLRSKGRKETEKYIEDIMSKNLEER
ncbi:MAG: bifunctional precorrin-2 dehydrogenase/sirohydrochlorin ferrochelatase [Nitrospinae bacterium]|nr:bifunctional precorrin-2 dehydrogenase/sirohydrochlorin ferrochelatase [Nitrospinota bacterium]